MLLTASHPAAAANCRVRTVQIADAAIRLLASAPIRDQFFVSVGSISSPKTKYVQVRMPDAQADEFLQQ